MWLFSHLIFLFPFISFVDMSSLMPVCVVECLSILVYHIISTTKIFYDTFALKLQWVDYIRDAKSSRANVIIHFKYYDIHKE